MRLTVGDLGAVEVMVHLNGRLLVDVISADDAEGWVERWDQHAHEVALRRGECPPSVPVFREYGTVELTWPARSGWTRTGERLEFSSAAVRKTRNANS